MTPGAIAAMKMLGIGSAMGKVIAAPSKASENGVDYIDHLDNKYPVVGIIDGKAIISSGINTPEAFGIKSFGTPYHPIETLVKPNYKAPTMRSNIKKGKRK